ncbi:hypothetical protein CPB83DRAFT_300476 [Crepidotus variabilis]|uniref:non-specific serine/threonine protein kinase n=1 Tax=Crepidotus variabilis TaxID=179855 RepID=A0A9P6JPS6_9AGAR|nr:hypothetical protein CPB83DRAFT_300476 [Crepidotus variabilis]
MAPSNHGHSSTSLQIPPQDNQGSSRQYPSSATAAHPPHSGGSQARPISVAAHTSPSSQSQSAASRRQRASHNVVSPTANQTPDGSSSHQDNTQVPYTDVYSHPAAVAYAAAHPRRTIPKFGPYLLLQTLGEGEFGKVKLGLHCQWGEEVAVKLIRRGNVDSSVRMSKIEREIEVLKMLKHPNIVRLYDVIETDKYIGIILEYASGGELFDHILAHRYLKERDAAKLFSQLISGVWYIHQKKIVHRDLKLENLLLDRNRNVIITDFGFANRFEHKADDLMQTSCGSPCYAAPELVISEGLYVGSAVDIWSCGVILYAMLAGYLPFDDDPANPDGDNINLLYKYIVSTPLSFPDYISMEARDLLSTMLVPDPSRRTTLDMVMRHSWLSAYQNTRTDGIPNSFGKTVDELEKAAMDQHNIKRQIYQRQMRQAAAIANGPVIPPSRTQSHRPEASAPSSSGRSRSTQPEYLYDSSAAEQPTPPPAAASTSTPTQNGTATSRKAYGSPAALGLAEDDPFAGPGGSTPNPAGSTNSKSRISEDRTAPTQLSPTANKGHKQSASGGGSGAGGSGFRHTIQVEYDDPSKARRGERKERSGSQDQGQPSQQKHQQPSPQPPAPAAVKERRPSQSGTKPLPPSPPTAAPSSYRGPPPPSKAAIAPSSDNATPTKSRPSALNGVHHSPEINVTSPPATPSASAGSESQQDRDNTSSTTSVNLTAAEKPKQSRRNTLTVMVEPFSRSIRGKKGGKTTGTPLTAEGASMANGGKGSNLKSSPQPQSAILPQPNGSTTPIADTAFSPQENPNMIGMPASSTKAKKVMQWFRSKSKGRDSVGFPTEESSTPRQGKYQNQYSTSSSSIHQTQPSTALGLTESAMSPQVIVTQPNSARPAAPGHPQRSASQATDRSTTTPGPFSRIRNSITSSSGQRPRESEKTSSNPSGQLRIHHGAVDPSAVTTRPPPEVMQHVRKVLEGMGMEIQLEHEYKYRCIRTKKRKGTMAPSTPNGATSSASPSSPSTPTGNGLAAVTMIGSAASNGVDKRGLPLPSPSAFVGTGGMLRGLLMRRQSSQVSTHGASASSPSLAFDDETSPVVSEPLVVSDIAYGDPSQDAGDEVRFSVELTRIDRLNDTYSLDIRRLKGNLRSYKFLYDTFRERTDISSTPA